MCEQSKLHGGPKLVTQADCRHCAEPYTNDLNVAYLV